MRYSEQYGARWQEVDFEHRILTVTRDKGRRTSHVRLNDAALLPWYDSVSARWSQATCAAGRSEQQIGLRIVCGLQESRDLRGIAFVTLCQPRHDGWC